MVLLVTKAQACESLSISMRQLKDYINRSEIATKRLGRKCVRIERAELERFVESITQRGPADVAAG